MLLTRSATQIHQLGLCDIRSIRKKERFLMLISLVQHHNLIYCLRHIIPFTIEMDILFVVGFISRNLMYFRYYYLAWMLFDLSLDIPLLLVINMILIPTQINGDD